MLLDQLIFRPLVRYTALQIRRRHRQSPARQSVVLQQSGLFARRCGAGPHAARAG
ncbi:hypothetical protein M8494_25155 [Serratia ureilytica]